MLTAALDLAASPFVLLLVALMAGACLWVHYTPTPPTGHAFTTRHQDELNRRLEVEGW